MKIQKLLVCFAVSALVTVGIAVPAFAAGKFQPTITANSSSYTIKANQGLYGHSYAYPDWRFNGVSSAGNIGWSGTYSYYYDPEFPDAGTVDADYYNFRYSSTNTKVATVDTDGNVRAVGAGSCDIIARYPSDEDNYEATKRVHVTVTRVSQSVSTPKSTYASSVGAGSFGLGASSKSGRTYSSSDTKVATVSSSGKVTPKGVGTCRITVKANASSVYDSASKTVTVKVNPKTASVSKVKGSKKSVKVSWKKQSKASATGYQVRVSKNASMSGSKTAMLKGTSKKFSRLKAGTVYYAQVRAYKKAGGKTYYGNWSAKKSARTAWGKPTKGQKRAVKRAKSYLDTFAFSKLGLVGQLKYEKFTTNQAEYAVEHCGANWKKQAVRSAKSYLKTFPGFSRQELIDQLKYEKFTPAQANYGAKKAW